MDTKADRYEGIDGLKAYAIIGIALMHVLANGESVLGSLSFNQAHNEWLQCLWQGGIILFVILVLLLITIAGKINRIQHRNLRFMCCMFFISVFIEMAFEVWLGLVFTWLMLLLIYKAESIQSEVG